MEDLFEYDATIYNEVVKLVETGNVFEESGLFKDAFEHYLTAWDKLPQSKIKWDTAEWISTCLCDICKKLDDLNEAKKWALLSVESRVSDVSCSPYIEVGMVCYDLEEYKEAFAWFDKAYQIGNKRTFEGVPKQYLEFYLKQRMEH